MASLEKKKTKNGFSYTVRFLCWQTGKNKCVFLGPVSKGLAEEHKVNIGKLVIALRTGDELAGRLKLWVDALPPKIRKGYETAGLLEPTKNLNLGQIWDAFLGYCEKRMKQTGRKQIKESTIRTYESVQKRFFRYFEKDNDPNELTEEDCSDWLDWIVTEGNNGKPYSEASRAGCVQRCGAVFNWAVDNGYIRQNPFKGIERGSFVNEDKRHFITAKEYQKLLAVCPDQTLRTYLALCRYGGLRKSEPMYLTWADVNWEKNLLQVHSPKTAHHRGKDTRLIPLYPELLVELRQQFQQAEPGGCPYIIDQWRDCSGSAVYNQIKKLVFMAGLEQWPDLIQNMRRSRDIELSTQYPAHVAAAWMGHSPVIAAKHYLFPTDDDIQKAVQQPTSAVNPAGSANIAVNSLANATKTNA